MTIVNKKHLLLAALYPSLLLANGSPDGTTLAYDWSHSLYAPYTSIEGKNHYWDFDALISMYNFVQLTPSIESKIGWVFSKTPIEADNWVIEAYFKISAENPHYAGDGMALWFSQDRYVAGHAFGYKEDFKGLGIFFDIFPNENGVRDFPWISAMIGDGIKLYDHNTDGRQHQIGGCHAKIVNTKAPVQAKVSYSQKTLELHLRIEGGEYTPCFKVPNVELPRKGYIGMTAKTGGLSANHQVLGIITALIEPLPPTTFSSIPLIANAEEVHSAIFLFLLFTGFIVLGTYLYKRQRKRHHF